MNGSKKEEIFEALKTGKTPEELGYPRPPPTPATSVTNSHVALAVMADAIYTVTEGGSWGPFVTKTGGTVKFNPRFVHDVVTGKKTATRRVFPRGIGRKYAQNSSTFLIFAELDFVSCIPEPFVTNFLNYVVTGTGSWKLEMDREGIPELSKLAKKKVQPSFARFYSIIHALNKVECDRLWKWESSSEVEKAVNSVNTLDDAISFGLRFPTLFRHGFNYAGNGKREIMSFMRGAKREEADASE